MAYPGKTITNPVTGQTIRFLRTGRETDGRLLEMESILQPHSTEPVPHYHPQQDEDFTVLQGEISVRLNGELHVLRAGDKLHIPRGQVHSMWNDTDRPAAVNWQVRPALETDHFLETGMGLTADGKVNAAGMPNLLQAALLVNRYSNVYRLARPPFVVQQVLFALLSPLAYLCGYRSSYRKYLE